MAVRGRSGDAPAARRHPADRGWQAGFLGHVGQPEATDGPLRGPATIFDRGKFPPFKPGGEAFYEPRTGDPRHDEPRAFCMPSGFPSAFLGPYPVQIIQNAK